jgi:OOP family OmpA-OmpF porin
MGTYSGEFRVQGANLGLVGTLPFTENLSGLARIGVQYARTRANIAGTGAAAATVTNPNPSDRETNAKIGLGLQYAFSPSFLMRGEVERFRISDAVGNHPQVAMYSVSLVFPFGRTEAAPRHAMATSDYAAPVVAQAPAAQEQPAVTLAPIPRDAPLAAFAPPQTRRVSYTAESFFSFDRADLQPAGKAALDTFAGELAGASFDTIAVQGHADRIGTTAYNQDLSLQRAEAVKSYLVNNGHLDAAKITTIGMSESEPVTVPDACKGPVTESLIACLKPDRRVEIEVTAQR